MLLRKTRNTVSGGGGYALAAALICATAATGAWAGKSNKHPPPADPTIPTYYPTPTRHYMERSVNVCDQGSFFVGGKLKSTYYGSSSTRSTTPKVIMIGAMYVQFQIPMKFKDYPIIFVSGGAHTERASSPRPTVGKAGGRTLSARIFRPLLSTSRDAVAPGSTLASFTKASPS